MNSTLATHSRLNGEKNTTKFRAYGNRLLVDAAQSAITEGGIHLPDGSSATHIAIGKVVSVGQGQQTTGGYDRPQVKIGDEIVFERVRGVPVHEAGEFIVSLWGGDIMAVRADAELEPREGK